MGRFRGFRRFRGFGGVQLGFRVIPEPEGLPAVEVRVEDFGRGQALPRDLLGGFGIMIGLLLRLCFRKRHCLSIYIYIYMYT